MVHVLERVGMLLPDHGPGRSPPVVGDQGVDAVTMDAYAAPSARPSSHAPRCDHAVLSLDGETRLKRANNTFDCSSQLDTLEKCGKSHLTDVWALDTATKPYEWRKLEPEGEGSLLCILLVVELVAAVARQRLGGCTGVVFVLRRWQRRRFRALSCHEFFEDCDIVVVIREFFRTHLCRRICSRMPLFRPGLLIQTNFDTGSTDKR